MTTQSTSTSTSTRTASTKHTVVLERRFRATREEVWDLWTTRDGFESWWGPEGFRVEVQEIDVRVGGAHRYDMIADAPEQIAAMKEMGQPTSHPTRSTFAEVRHLERLAITSLIDFLPGVEPYDTTAVMELFAEGDLVRMVITVDVMHDAHWTKMATMGWESQLRKLEARFSARSA